MLSRTTSNNCSPSPLTSGTLPRKNCSDESSLEFLRSVMPKNGKCQCLSHQNKTEFAESLAMSRSQRNTRGTVKRIFAHQRKNFDCITLLDASMQFHTFQFCENSTLLCFILTTPGKFGSTRLAVECLNGPAWAQGAMKELLRNFACTF